MRKRPRTIRRMFSRIVAHALVAALFALGLGMTSARAYSAAGVSIVDELIRHPAIARADALRSVAASDSLRDVMRVALARSPATGGASLTPGVTSVTAAIDRLLHVISRSRDIVRNAVPASARAALARTTHALMAGAIPPRTTSGFTEPRVPVEVRNLAKVVDGKAISMAASDIAAAIDALLAVRQRAPAQLESLSDAPCDVVDQFPQLCVSGGGDTIYPPSSRYWLTVDLGGDDRYGQPVGAAGPCAPTDPPTDTPNECVNVLVDLAGNDIYDSPGEPGSLVTQGAGLSAIGMLVDAGGDDVYRADVVPTSGSACGDYGRCGTVRAQGFAFVGGVGVLADLSGEDSYSASIPVRAVGDAQDTWGVVAAQGYSSFGSAMLLDGGPEADSYSIAGPASGYVTPVDDRVRFAPFGMSQYSGQASAWGGPAVLLDQGGPTRIEISALAGSGAAESRTVSSYGEGAGALVFGQAFSVDGSPYGLSGGELVTGDDDTEYVVDISARFVAHVQAQHRGSEHNVLDDMGGNDLYRIRVDVTGEMSTRCDCEEALLQLLPDPVLTTYPYLAAAQVYGQASRSVISAKTGGLLHDRGGADRYEVIVASDFDAVAQTTSPTGRAQVDAVQIGFVGVCVQACGSDLFDVSGDDTYTTDVTSTLSARALGGGASDQALAVLRPLGVFAQGSSTGNPLGRLVDGGGTDRYEMRARPVASVFPAGDGRVDDATPVYMTAQGLGSIGGLLLDMGAGSANRFDADSVALLTTCQGRYREAPGWTNKVGLGSGNCESTGGGSSLMTVVPGVNTAVEFLSVTPESVGGHNVARAEVRLTDASGSPIAGRRVVVYLFMGTEHGGRWLTTDENGVAVGRVMLGTPMRSIPNGDLKLRAVYPGASGEHRPAATVSSTFRP